MFVKVLRDFSSLESSFEAILFLAGLRSKVEASIARRKHWDGQFLSLPLGARLYGKENIAAGIL